MYLSELLSNNMNEMDYIISRFSAKMAITHQI